MAMQSRSLSPWPTPRAWVSLGQGTQQAIVMVTCCAKRASCSLMKWLGDTAGIKH